MKTNISMRTTQTGATLIVALIILIVLMVLGVAAVLSANTQFKLAGNLQFESEAKIRAENRITDAETYLITIDPATGLINAKNPAFFNPTACTARTIAFIYGQDCFPNYAAPNNDPLTMTWDDTNSIADANGNRYLIELVTAGRAITGESGKINPLKPKFNVYRITARGTNARGAVRFVQSIYQVKA